MSDEGRLPNVYLCIHVPLIQEETHFTSKIGDKYERKTEREGEDGDSADDDDEG